MNIKSSTEKKHLSSPAAAVDKHTAAVARGIAEMGSSPQHEDGDELALRSSEATGCRDGLPRWRLDLHQNPCRTDGYAATINRKGSACSTAGEFSSSQRHVRGPIVGGMVYNRVDSRG